MIPGFNLETIDNELTYPHNGKFGKCRFEIIEKSDAGGYNRPTMKFQILGQYPREGKRWQIGEETARQLERDGKVEIVDGIVKKAIYPEDEVDRIQYKPFWSLIRENKLLTSEENETAQNGKEEINNLFNCPLFDTVKPTKLLQKLIFHITNQDCIILDFFSGTATTAHAIMKQNAIDNIKRKFILIQIPEETDKEKEAYKAGYSNLCEIGKERIRRAGKKIKEENSLSAINIDTGFRVLKLDSTNMKDVYYNPEEITQNTLDGLIDNIKGDRTNEDLLFQTMLELGVPLSSTIKEETIGGVTVFNVGKENFLIATFDSGVTDDVVKQIALKKPYYFVVRDSSMDSDAVAANFEQIFKTYSPDTKRKVL